MALGRALAASLSGFIGAPLSFLGASLLWSLGFIGLVLIAGRAPASVLIFGPLLMPLGCGLLRMATLDARDRVVRIGAFSDGVAQRIVSKLLLGALQVALLLAAALNLQLGLSLEGLPGAALTIMAAYLLLAVWTLALVLWPLMTDPLRDERAVRSQLVLAVRVLFTRPVQATLAGLLALGGLYAGAELIAPLAFVPGLAALMSAHLVLPIADRLDPPETDERER